MATVPVQTVPAGGLAAVPFQAADSAGDDVAPGPGVMLLVRNDDTASHTATVTTSGTVEGLAVEDPALAVAAGDIGALTLLRVPYGSSASITYDAVTSVSVAAVRLAR